MTLAIEISRPFQWRPFIVDYGSSTQRVYVWGFFAVYLIRHPLNKWMDRLLRTSYRLGMEAAQELNDKEREQS